MRSRIRAPMGRSPWRAVHAATAALLAVGVATAIAVVAPPASAAYGPQYVGSATRAPAR